MSDTPNEFEAENSQAIPAAASEQPQGEQSRHRKVRLAICCVLILGSGALLFARLGHSALWDDESYTALGGIAVWRTGDTSAVLDHNIVANRAGVKLRNMKLRFHPPLMFYLAAPSLGLLGETSFAARLPFALCGLATIALIAWWMWRDDADVVTWLVMSIGILGNISLILYLRQCRYYAPSIFFSVLLAYMYLHWNGKLRWLAIMSLALVALLASNYLAYAAFVVCVLVDYFIWQGRQRRLDWRGWLILTLPQVVLGGLIASVWNPIGKSDKVFERTSWLGEHLRILWWTFRDLNACEFGVGALLILAPLLYFLRKDKWLLRGPLAIFLYCLVVAMCSPQKAPPNWPFYTLVRYLAPLIPLCIFVSARAILAIPARVRLLAVPLAILAFGTNVLHGGPYSDRAVSLHTPKLPRKSIHSNFVRFLGELIDPPPSACRATAEWINRNVAPRQTVWAVPEYAAYPLMFYAREPVYAWQLRDPPAEQFKSLPDIHFQGRVPPDYVVVFGPEQFPKWALKWLENWKRNGRRVYSRIHVIPLYWYDLVRPEPFAHAFGKVTSFDPNKEGVLIFGADTRQEELP